MAGVLHGSARAVPRVRAELQASQKAARVLAAQHRLHAHIFDRVCREHSIEHKLTRPYHPRINGQAERTIKEERHR